MIRDIHNPNGKYHMLTDDDMILKDDEYYDYNEDRWFKVDETHIGDFYRGPYGYDHFLIIRRPNPEYKVQRDPWI